MVRGCCLAVMSCDAVVLDGRCAGVPSIACEGSGWTSIQRTPRRADQEGTVSLSEAIGITLASAAALAALWQGYLLRRQLRHAERIQRRSYISVLLTLSEN
jgi:hypothetical protein